ncbi:MAG TPA: S-methyl-5-thioribose-1-phosphate isomerase [Candidatus Methanoperedens sp.]|nr:S-methyl-5-thioribose-1-phosphate isomerase [Candidatus Methanoperedens sp.]
MVETLRWRRGRLELLDQTLLPERVVYRPLGTAREVAAAIREMLVRGAPAIGVAAAFGMALAARQAARRASAGFARELARGERLLAASRPTAVNLFWALARMRRLADGAAAAGRTPRAIAALLEAEALRVLEEDVAINRALGRHGAKLIADGDVVLTHCNAGALATAGYGTALGVVRAAWEAGKRISVLADETRPRCQGAKLTAWELSRDGIPVTVIADTAAGHFLRRGMVQKVVVGADRIAANGDVANKIGTYQVAVLARANRVPFYVAAPVSTFDATLRNGDAIPIEERAAVEVTHPGGRRLTPAGVPALNPAFDVTPARYVTGIITERGVLVPPYRRSIARCLAAGG